MKLLFVEDEKRLSEALSHLLRKKGYVVDTAENGETGLDLATTGFYDIIILDRMLPGIDGIAVLKAFRSQGFDTPVIFLTAKDSPRDRVEGLDAGADDYLVKPFSTDELLARLRALSRRKNKDFQENTIAIAGLILDPLRGEVVKDSTTIIQLSVNYGQVLTKARIFEKVWGYSSEIEFANVDLYIHYLRKKLNTSLIKTARGVGYYLEDGDDV